MLDNLVLLLAVVRVTGFAHGQFLVANVVEKLSKRHEERPFVVEGVPQSQHGSLSLRQVPQHPFRIVLVVSRLGPVGVGLSRMLARGNCRRARCGGCGGPSSCRSVPKPHL